MSFKNRREYLFVYSVKDANPNGDPLNANHPRYDPESGQIMVSDVRIKRTIRDQWMREGLPVFVDSEPKTLASRIEEIKNLLTVKTGKEALAGCLDTRLFGVTFAQEKESFSWTGPVQFKWGRSLHKAKAELIQGTGAFATKEGNDQRTFRNEYIVPFVVIGVYAIANQYAAATTRATDADLACLESGLWDGTTNLITRSKVGHQPRLFIEIKYREGFNGAIGSLDEKISLERGGVPLTDEEQLGLRSLSGAALNVHPIAERLAATSAQVEQVRVLREAGTQVIGLDELAKRFDGRYACEEK